MHLRSIAVVLSVPLALHAQVLKPDTTAVPADLVLGYMMGFGFLPPIPAVPMFVIGRVPAPEAQEFVLPGAVVLGGVLMSWNGAYRGSTTVSIVPDGDTAARNAAIAHLVRLGWRYPYEPSMLWKDGFQSTRASAVLGSIGTLCRDTASVSVVTGKRAGSGSYLSISHANAARIMGVCSPQRTDESMYRGQRPPEIPVPELIPPADAIGGQSGGSSGNGNRELTGQLRTALSPEKVVEYYAAQMARSGWTLGKLVSSKDAALQTMKAPHPRGEVNALLEDIRTPDGIHHVVLRLFLAKNGIER